MEGNQAVACGAKFLQLLELCVQPVERILESPLDLWENCCGTDDLDQLRLFDPQPVLLSKQKTVTCWVFV